MDRNGIASTRRRLMVLGGTAACIGPFARSAAAKGLPQGPLRIYVGYATGGGTDVLVRVIAEKLREQVQANIVIENRAGADGTLAVAAMKTVPTDGSVVLFAPTASTTDQVVTRKALPFDLDRDVMPITLAGTVSNVFAVSAKIGVSTLSEYTEWLKRNPDKQVFGTAAMGSRTHVFGAELGQAIGIPLQPIPYKGTGPMLTDIVGGHVPAGSGGLTSFLQHHRSGHVRILADSSEKRSVVAPDLPSIGELGHPKLAQEGFYAFYAPARTDPAVIEAWGVALRAVLAMPDLQKRLAELGLAARTSSPAEVSERQVRTIETYRQSLAAIGWKGE